MRLSSWKDAGEGARATSSQRLEQIAFHAVRDLGQVFARILQEVRRGTVSFKRGVILVLLVNEKAPRFRLVPVYLKHKATGFFARLFGQLRKNWGDVAIVPRLRHPRHRQNNHRALLTWISK